MTKASVIAKKIRERKLAEKIKKETAVPESNLKTLTEKRKNPGALIKKMRIIKRKTLDAALCDSRSTAVLSTEIERKPLVEDTTDLHSYYTEQYWQNILPPSKEFNQLVSWVEELRQIQAVNNDPGYTSEDAVDTAILKQIELIEKINGAIK